MSKEAALSMLTGSIPPPVPSASPENVPPTAPPQPAQLQSTPFSHLAKKEAELVRQRNEFKKDQETWGQERARLADAKKQYDQYNEMKKSDPVGALKMLGFSEQDIFNYMANAQPVELTAEQKAVQAAEQAADAKIKAFEENQTKKERDHQFAQDKEVIQSYRDDARQIVEKNSDKYEYCKFYGEEANALVWELASTVVKESQGKDFVTAEEAVQMAEEFYEEMDQSMNTLKKRQPKQAESVPTQTTQPTRTRTLSTPPTNSEAPKPTITKTRTLTNAATSTMASSRINRNETREQKRERLIDALRNGTMP